MKGAGVEACTTRMAGCRPRSAPSLPARGQLPIPLASPGVPREGKEVLEPLENLGAGVEGGESLADGVFGEVGYAGSFELGHEAAAVGFDRFCSDAEVGGDLLGKVAGGDAAEDFALTRSE